MPMGTIEGEVTSLRHRIEALENVLCDLATMEKHEYYINSRVLKKALKDAGIMGK